MMTPEERSKIEKRVREMEVCSDTLWAKDVIKCLAEIDRLTAENARLTKVVDQAIGWIDEGDHFIISDSGNYLELAAELEARSR